MYRIRIYMSSTYDKIMTYLLIYYNYYYIYIDILL